MQTIAYARPATVKIANREAWLAAAADRLWDRVIAAGGEKPKTIRYSCGWPSRKALVTASSNARTLGQAWHSAASEDGAREVFITPALAEECRVLDVLLHEMIHTALPADAGHGPAFQSIMRAVGLEGKPTKTVAGAELLDELRVLAHELGRYPHEKLDLEPGGRKPGRMVKGYCPDCQTILYGSRQAWEVIPTCGGCGIPFTIEPSEAQAAQWGLKRAEDTESLENVSTTVELRTKDGRFVLRSTKRGGKDGAWTVTDLEAIERTRRQLGDLTLYAAEPGDTAVLGGTEVVEYDLRWTYCRDRDEALAFIAAIRSGDLSWDDVAEVTDDEDEGDWDDEALGEPGDWSAEGDDEYLDEDEDEEPDFDDGHLDPEEEARYEAETAKREASGAAKSQRIAAGDEEAMD